MSKFLSRCYLTVPAASVCMVAMNPASAAIELLVDPSAGGALSLRATTPGESINGYTVFSAGGFLSDQGDETLGGQLSPIVFDVDNVGSDEVAFFNLGLSDPLNPLPPIAVPDTGNGLALNLAWTGASADPVADLSFFYGPFDLFFTNPDGELEQIDELPGLVVALVATGIVGDYDDSGQVEQGDLNLVLNNWGGAAPFQPNGDPFATPQVDQEELNRVLNNWGNSANPPSFTGAAVPEPGTAGLATAFLVAGAALRRRRVKSSEKF
ncbi:MAG: hypothetical protein AAF328_02485 [Planctomycetota bacterium]